MEPDGFFFYNFDIIRLRFNYASLISYLQVVLAVTRLFGDYAVHKRPLIFFSSDQGAGGHCRMAVMITFGP